ncbi:MAG: DUF6537 domain-containing protein, partial [Pseudomonadota bacterium]
TIVMGAAFQRGALPVSSESLMEAIRLNGAAVDMNLAAFQLGRISVAQPERFAKILTEARSAPLPHRVAPRSLDEKLTRFKDSLTAYQNSAYAGDFVRRIDALRDAASAHPGASKLLDAAARNLYKLMAMKDEYEVARLYADGGFEAQLKSQFESYERITFHLAPPGLTGTDPRTGRPRKRPFGNVLRRVFPILARMRVLRGTPLDIFALNAERRDERRLLDEYRSTLDTITAHLSADRLDAALALAAWPDTIKGYGPVRAAAMARARHAVPALTEEFLEPTAARLAAE